MATYDKFYKTEDTYTGQLKIILVGEPHVGKTNIITRYVDDSFSTNSLSTSSPSFYPKFMRIGEESYKLNLWDTAGQEKYHSLTKIFLQNVNIAILVYAINDKNSFEKIDFWYDTVKECSDNVSYCVCANKSDLIDELVVEHEQGKKYAESIGAHFFITSAKDSSDKNIDLMFEEVIKKYIKENKSKVIESQNSSFYMSGESLDRKSRRNDKNKKQCCSK